MEDIAAKGADTQAAIAAETISTMILSGDLKGGERLNIRDLVKQTGIGATPLREGVSRLIDRGFVKALDRRGFRVTETSAEDRLVNFMNWAPHDPREAALGFDAVHKAFHTALISACGSERMLAFLDMLYDQGFRYRHLMLTHHDPRQRLQGAQRIEEHNVLAELAIKRKPREAVEALQRHLSTFSGDVFKDKS